MKNNYKNLTKIELLAKVEEYEENETRINGYVNNILHALTESLPDNNYHVLETSKSEDTSRLYHIEEMITIILNKDKKLDLIKEGLKQARLDFQEEQVELLDAWNNFQNWKVKTSSNLIKDLNSKFKDEKNI
tara:strand:- start:283 stop:678 length:396 start_codon:yes stop_codon:yes gene_type:complete